MVNLGGDFPQNHFFLKHFILIIHQFTKLMFMGRWKFPHVRAIENFATEEIFYWVVS